VERSRLSVERLKGLLSVEQPVPDDELRAIGLFLSKRQTQVTRQAVNDITSPTGETAKLGRVAPCCATRAGTNYLADKSTDLRTMQHYLGHRDPRHTAHECTAAAGHHFDCGIGHRSSEPPPATH